MAVDAALQMRGRLLSVNQELQQRGYEPLFHGIGIHTGKVVAANIGSLHRLSYTLLGDTVNLASRLHGLNREFDTEIIIGGSTRAHLDDGPSLKKLPSARVKGKSQAVGILAMV